MLRNILVLGFLASAMVFAQGGRGGGGGGGRGGGDLAPAGNFGAVNKLDRFTDLLKLNKDQRKAFKQTFDDAQKEAAPLHDQIVKARVAVGEAVVAGKPQDDIAKAVTAEAALETQMAVIEMKAFTTVWAGLEQEQQQRAGMLFQMMRGLFNTKNWNSE